MIYVGWLAPLTAVAWLLDTLENGTSALTVAGTLLVVYGSVMAYRTGRRLEGELREARA